MGVGRFVFTLRCGIASPTSPRHFELEEHTMTDSPDQAVLRGVLDAWQKAIDEHHPERVAEVFAEDAVFQGLHPYSVGRPGVAAYYAAQPVGMTVTYRILQTHRLAAGVVLGWVAADFRFADESRPPVEVSLTVVAHRTGGAWQIAHYHVSPRIEAVSTLPH
jgi:uncharacterized protein (TIGR02246 family)